MKIIFVLCSLNVSYLKSLISFYMRIKIPGIWWCWLVAIILYVNMCMKSHWWVGLVMQVLFGFFVCLLNNYFNATMMYYCVKKGKICDAKGNYIYLFFPGGNCLFCFFVCAVEIVWKIGWVYFKFNDSLIWDWMIEEKW